MRRGWTIRAGPARVVAGAVALAAALLLAPPVLAGGPLSLCESGRPYLWPDGGRNIPYSPDRGPLGLLTSASAQNQTNAAFANWEGVASATASYVNAGPLPLDVDANSFLPFFLPAAPDGVNAVVYDADGSIFQLLFGTASGVLGFAGPEWVDPAGCTILEGRAFLNGGAILAGFPAGEFLSVQVHEFGHFTGLAHTVVNEQIAAFDDYTGPTPFDTFGYPVDLAGRIETMSPFIFINGGMATPHKDDVAILSTLYPEPDFRSSTGSIRGTIYAPNGVPVRGVNVIARSLDDPFEDAVSAISGDFSGTLPYGDPLTGRYRLNGLTPGRAYAVYVDQILAGGFSTPPAILPGDEEFWNALNESNDSRRDIPWLYSPVSSLPGTPRTGIDIYFNSYPPGGIALEDDDSERIFPVFPVEFCGEVYDSVFVNSNGSLTFGAPDPDYTESAGGLLDGPPRIAALWDDLNPEIRGNVFWSQTEDMVLFRYMLVPEYPDAGSNSFEIRLLRPSGKIEIEYGPLTASGGLAGLSCGGAATTGLEAESDLTTLADASEDGTLGSRNETALFEVFSDQDNDLSGRLLRFNVPKGLRDTNEPNDDPGKATRVRLPFDSSRRFTAIDPEGGDVDYFRFRARAGESLIAEVVRGQMDTLLGLFDLSTGDLVAVDDDGGEGMLSRLVFPVETEGLYALAVTTYPDTGFTGAGGGRGRYVLRVRSVEGTALLLGDDDSVEVPLEGFTFPFQGQAWTSVFVNSNGNLTFGESDLDYTESVTELLNGPPRIAPLWDDLAPAGAEQIRIFPDASSLTVLWDEVPEYTLPGGNTFRVTLRSTGEITISYGYTTRGGGLVGVTPGEGAPDPGPSDLSTSSVWPAAGTTYQRFFRGQFDLDLSSILFTPFVPEPPSGNAATGPGRTVPPRRPPGEATPDRQDPGQR